MLVNAKAIGTHPSAWGLGAARFVPERHSFAQVPFGIGGRSSRGVHFATAVVELVLANLLFLIGISLSV